MTITLSWWAFPLLVFIVAAFLWVRGGHRRLRYGVGHGVWHVVISLALAVVAVSFTAGRATAGFV